MKEELQNQLVEQVGDIAEMTKEGIMKAVEVIQEQCPLLVNEILTWHFVQSLILFALGMFLLASFWLYAKKMWRYTIEKENEFWIVCVYITITQNLIGVVFVFTNLTWLKIAIAPRLFLMEYISTLIK